MPETHIEVDQIAQGRAGIGRSTVVLLFTAALVARALVALWLPAEIVWPDGERYVKVALNLLSGDGFGPLRDNQLSVPTQPVLIAAIYSAFGESFLALRLAMAALGALTCVLGYLIARRLFDDRAAFVAGVILCFYPYFVYLSALFEYPQPLFMLAMAGFFVLFYRWERSRNDYELAMAGLVLGIAVLTVPTALIFLLCSGVLLLDRDLGGSLRRMVVFFVAALLPIGGWAARNHNAYGHIVLFNSAGGYSLWQANNDTYLTHGKPGIVPPCGPGYESTSFCVEYSELNRVVGGSGMPDVEQVLEFDRVAKEKAWEFIWRDPVVSIKLSFRKFAELWSPIPNAVTKGEAQGGRAATWLSLLTYVPLLLLAIFGVLRSRAQWRRFVPLYLYVLTMVAPYCIFLPTTRYRLPVDFVLAIFAAHGVVSTTVGGRLLDRLLPRPRVT